MSYRRVGRGALHILLWLGLFMASATAPVALAQSRIRTMPGYERWSEMAPKLAQAVKSGAITVQWAQDSRSFEYTRDTTRWRFDLGALAKKQIAPAASPPVSPAARPAGAGDLVLARGRGREADVLSPDGSMRAFSRDFNMWLAPASGGSERQITFDGGREARVRHGVGSYVYLEEFMVSQPVWWSPDGTRVAWMRYDETAVDDYFLTLDLTRMFSTQLTQAYPHPGRNNPVADLLVYDVRTGLTKVMDVRNGAVFGNDVIGHYAWGGQWTKDGSEILVLRADRLQKHYDLAACEALTGQCRTVVRESRPQTWAEGAAPRFLQDGRRFIWISERNDFRNLYLYDISGKQLARLTSGSFDVTEVIKVDEKSGWLWYMARSGPSPLRVQLHRVKLDGSGDKRLTDITLTHRVDVSPDGRYFIDVEQAYNRAPVSRLRDFNGKLVADIEASDVSGLGILTVPPAELFTFTSADGETELHGLLQFPSDFDPTRRYPVLLSVYGGPSSNGLTEAFAAPNPLTEYGFLVLKLDARTNTGRGRKVMDAAYKQLGIAEIDDFAAGIRAIGQRPYVDPARVGVFGTSYGGSVAALLLLRYPDLVQAAVSNSPVTDFRLYDTAYSERYLGLPENDREAYGRASVLTYAGDLRGDLLIYYGTSDDNVHPKNALQLIKALQQAGKSFEVQVGPDRGHTGVDQVRMMEFFIQHLVIAPSSRSSGEGLMGPAGRAQGQ